MRWNLGSLLLKNQNCSLQMSAKKKILYLYNKINKLTLNLSLSPSVKDFVDSSIFILISFLKININVIVLSVEKKFTHSLSIDDVLGQFNSSARTISPFFTGSGNVIVHFLKNLHTWPMICPKLLLCGTFK